MSTSNNLSNVTFNGQPLTDVLGKEASNEMHEALSDAAPRVARRAAGSKHTRNHSNTKSSVGITVYRAEQLEQMVRFCDEVFEWKDKLPYVVSGESIKGGFEMTRDLKKIKCHECGDFVECLNVHVPLHSISPRRYKINHGIRMSSSMRADAVLHAQRKLKTVQTMRVLRTVKAGGEVSRYLRDRVQREIELTLKGIDRATRSFAENNNLRSRCEAQRIKALQDFALHLGHTPTNTEMLAYRDKDGCAILAPIRLRRFFGISRAALFARAGLSPASLGGCPKKEIPAEKITRLIAARAAGLSIRAIAKRTGLPASTVHRYLRNSAELPLAIAKAESRITA